MNFLDNAEVSIDLPFLDTLISAAKWQVEHVTEKVTSCDVITWLNFPKMEKKGC